MFIVISLSLTGIHEMLVARIPPDDLEGFEAHDIVIKHLECEKGVRLQAVGTPFLASGR